jgi:hypothetical protein
VDLPSRQLDTLLSSRFDFIYAVGDTDAQGGLLTHTAGGHPYGGMDMRLTTGMPVAAPAAEPIAAPTPQAPAPPPAVPAPTPPAAEAAAAGAPVCALQLAGGETREFAACTSVPRLGTNFDLMWSLEPPAGGAAAGANASLRLGLRAEAGGWVAVGFPAVPGRMLGATAFILKTCPAPDCPSGAEVRDYFLAERSYAGVQPPGALAVADAAAVSADGVMHGTITVRLAGLPAPAPPRPSHMHTRSTSSLGCAGGSAVRRAAPPLRCCIPPRRRLPPPCAPRRSSWTAWRPPTPPSPSWWLRGG